MFRMFMSLLLSLILAIEPALAAPPTELDNLMNAYVKETGLTKGVSVKKFWSVAKKGIHPELASVFESNFMRVPDGQKMPPTTIAKTKLKNGKEGYRMIMGSGSKAITMDFYIDDKGEPKALYSGKTYTYFDFYYRGEAERVNKSIVLMPHKLKQLAAEKKYKELADYYGKLRGLVAALEDVQMAFNKPKASTSKTSYINWLLDVTSAWGANDGEGCIIGGWVGSYSKNICIHPKVETIPQQWQESLKQCKRNGGVFCNPIIYGYGGREKSNCSPKEETTHASKNHCDTIFPIGSRTNPEPSNLKSLIESVTTKKPDNCDGNNCEEWRSRYERMLKHETEKATGFCMASPNDFDALAQDKHEFKPENLKKGLKEDQVTACIALLNRHAQLQCQGSCGDDGATEETQNPKGDDSVFSWQKTPGDCLKQGEVCKQQPFAQCKDNSGSVVNDSKCPVGGRPSYDQETCECPRVNSGTSSETDTTTEKKWWDEPWVPWAVFGTMVAAIALFRYHKKKKRKKGESVIVVPPTIPVTEEPASNRPEGGGGEGLL